MAYLAAATAVDVVDPSDGKLSLREAVAQANAGAGTDTIRFLAALEGKILVPTGGELVINRDLTIDGDRNGDDMRVTVDGNLNGRVLDIQGAATRVTIKGLELTRGNPGGKLSGGAILLGVAVA